MSLRILVVDDETNARKSLAIGLRLEGHEIVEASHGEEALMVLERAAKAGRMVDVAIVDLMMPRMSGLDLARRVRFRHADVRVVLMSAYHLSKRQLERADVGAVGFVPKPFDMDELVAFLERRVPSEPPSAEIALG